MTDLVFVYGTLRKGCGNHRLLTEQVKLGKDTIKGYRMYSLHGGFPGVVEGNEQDYVVGEVYEVDTIRRLDGLEGYRPDEPKRGLYDRKQVETIYGTAWVYIYNPPVNGEVITDWKEYHG